MKKKIIGILSCKGGVGKSTITINIATFLSFFFHKKIGLFDADLYGPNHSKLLGLDEGQKHEFKNIEILKYKILSVSIGHLLNKNSSILLRGPMVSNTLLYLYKKIANKNLDMLFIDFPPGTGDTYLSLLRDIKFSGIFIITTPHSTSIEDINRSISMLNKFNIKILGIIKNMNFYKCKYCKTSNYIYGNSSKFNKFISEYNISNIYNFPLHPLISHSANLGLPFIFFESCKTLTQEIKKICHLFL